MIKNNNDNYTWHTSIGDNIFPQDSIAIPSFSEGI